MKQKHISTLLALGLTLVFILAACQNVFNSSPIDIAKQNVSQNCIKLTEDTAYYRISGFLYQGDAVNLWKDIQYLKDTNIRIIGIYLDSPGGDPYTAFAYVDIIEKAKEMGFTVDIRAYGMVMSAAVPIMVAGSHRVCGVNVGFMMHKPYVPETTPFGFPEEIFEQIKRSIEAVANIYAGIIADRTKLTVHDVKEMLSVKGTFFNAYKALEMGFIDEIETKKNTG